MRLINVDVLIEKLEEKMFNSQLMCPIIKITDALSLIEEQPTAYNVEKVVSELEKKDDDCGCGKIHIWDAIDIVKNGGK